jgi:hypothetical protein
MTKPPEKSAFTAGPWQISHTSGTHVVSDANGHTDVAWIGFWTSRECIAKLSEAEQQANARLIASAPELYALVRSYRISNPLDAYADHADNLIAKIEGEK